MQPVRATYLIDGTGSLAEERARALLLEQTVELPRAAVRDRFVESAILPELVSVEAESDRSSRVTLDIPAVTTALEAAQLVNVLFGNASLLPGHALVGIELPTELRIALGGPRHGIEGLRRATGVAHGPLSATALKPMGLDAGALAELAATFARAGIDVIKDDHGLADHPFCPFDERVARCQEAVLRVADETGHRALYVPNLIGGPRTIARQWHFARDQGVGAVMLAPMLVGLAAFHEFAQADADVPVFAHPALAGAGAIAPGVLLGRLFRAFGADAVIYPHAGGRFRYDEPTCRALADALRDGWEPLAPALPMPAGGMSVERVAELLRVYGDDVALLVGGSLYLAGDRLEARAREFVSIVRQARGGTSA